MPGILRCERRAHRTCSEARSAELQLAVVGGPGHLSRDGSCGVSGVDEVFLTLLPDGVFSLRQTYRDAQCAPRSPCCTWAVGSWPRMGGSPARQWPGVAAAPDHRRPPNAPHPRSPRHHDAPCLSGRRILQLRPFRDPFRLQGLVSLAPLSSSLHDGTVASTGPVLNPVPTALHKDGRMRAACLASRGVGPPGRFGGRPQLVCPQSRDGKERDLPRLGIAGDPDGPGVRPADRPVDGVYDDKKVQDYVSRLGMGMAAKSERPSCPGPST